MAVYIDSATAQFENVNVLRHYPFTEDCSFVDSQERELPAEVIADVHVVVPSDVAVPDKNTVNISKQPVTPVVRLTGVHLSPAMVSVCFSVEYNGVQNALSVTVARANFRPYFPYRMKKLAGTSDMGGVVVFGDINFPGFSEIYRFVGDASNNAIVHPGCVAMAKPAELRRFIDRRSGESIAGDVRIAFSSYVESRQDEKSIGLSLTDGAAAALASDCLDMSGDNPCGATPLRTINGVYPDEDGNIVLWFH